MSLSKYLKKGAAYARILLTHSKYVIIDSSQWDKSLLDSNKFYLDAFRFFYFKLPVQLKLHKYYFNKNSRGFGEKAFHTMWYLLYEKYQFQNFLEIGVYRGQTISLISLLAQLKKTDVTVYGISPFNNAGDDVSKYVEINYELDVLNNFNYFSIKPPVLIKAFSTDKIAINVISCRQWDCIYIDGSHDYDIAKQDWLNCSKKVKVGGIIVLDDASLYTNYKAPFFAFNGHPGPSKVAEEIKGNSHFKEVLRIGHNRVFEKIS